MTLALGDGGYRGPLNAAIGWIIHYVGVMDGSIMIGPMAAEAKYVYAGIKNYFLAEVLASDNVLNIFIDMYVVE